MSVLAYMGYYYYDMTVSSCNFGRGAFDDRERPVNSTFKRYSRVRSSCGMTGAEAAERILYRNGLTNVRIEHISGNLTDHYDPSSKVLRLSDATYNATSVAAVGVAAHECGHAVQDARGYAPLKFRSALVPAGEFRLEIRFADFRPGAVLWLQRAADADWYLGLFGSGAVPDRDASG